MKSHELKAKSVQLGQLVIDLYKARDPRAPRFRDAHRKLWRFTRQQEAKELAHLYRYATII